ncbi:hypothetical protein OKW21_000230 [Catalinimonas alkaloidigena]|uniref:hypothetical protein n=1 Tax=Catalinimonas alkaloidigena TaxID=1075417 RepID=UPI0024066DC0|nr:hypothetical protein [Catalinimonas alkaloidigena]MDF9794967.1 hypothetical protein [Catalinimonas alkaloidigena]
MYYSEKITPGILRKIQEGEDNRHYKTNGSRIVFTRNCKYCGGEFWPRRKNHMYCSASCKVQKCNAKKKSKTLPKSTPSLASPTQQTIDLKAVGESALGSAAVSGLKYLAHDLPLMNKLDKIITAIDGKIIANTPIFTSPLNFLGLTDTGAVIVALFENPKNGRLLACDSNNRWMKQVSKQPEKWEFM